MGYQVWEFDEVDQDYDYDELKSNSLRCCPTTTIRSVGNRVFEHFVVIGAYVQHVAFISRYFRMQVRMISSTHLLPRLQS